MSIVSASPWRHAATRRSTTQNKTNCAIGKLLSETLTCSHPASLFKGFRCDELPMNPVVDPIDGGGRDPGASRPAARLPRVSCMPSLQWENLHSPGQFLSAILSIVLMTLCWPATMPWVIALVVRTLPAAAAIVGHLARRGHGGAAARRAHAVAAS